MSLLDLLSNWNVGTILARSWYMADDPPSHSDLGAQFKRLCLLLSDQNRLRAVGLHAAYNHCRSQITNDKSALETLEHQHYNLQCSVAPTHRLPAEIMMEIFHIALDVGQLRSGLMHVCRRWCTIIEGMASVWSSLNLGAGTTPERVQHFLSRAGTHPLTVEIDTNKARSTAGELNLFLSMAGNKASQWRTLTITSLPQDEPDAQVGDALISTRLQPMRQLTHLNIKEPVLSPLLRLLLQNVATAAVGKLVSMEIHSIPAIQYLLQPLHVSIYCSLTTFIAKVPKMRRPIDLLPHFMQLEVLDLTNLHLSIIDNGSPLPLARFLRFLRLKAVSIQWMGGQVFSQLEDCTIIAPLPGSSPHYNVQLPACTKLHFENWDIFPIGQFSVPEIDHLRVKSNAWRPHTGNRQVVQLVGAGIGMAIQPKSLSLSIVCKEKVLLAVLRLLPGLVELKLDLPRPSALGKHFFTELLAKPGNQGTRFDWRELFRENSTGWRCTVCPSLRILELKYQRWLRPVYNDDFLPPLYALGYSREKTATPLQLQVHYKSYMNFLGLWNSTLPQVGEAISCLKIPQYGHITHLSLRTGRWNNSVYENPFFVPFFYHLQILEIKGPLGTGKKVLHILPFCHELRELNLSSIDVPRPARGVDLPFVHTLQKLSLSNSTLAWMDGLVFAHLQTFVVDEHGWPQTFRQKVGMPACTHLAFLHYRLIALPVLQSNFQLPFLDTLELGDEWETFRHSERAFSALQRILAKRLKCSVISSFRGLSTVFESKDEIEQLDLLFKDKDRYYMLSGGYVEVPSGVPEILTMMSEANHITKKVRCPNMKVLRLQFGGVRGTLREPISQLCRQMMIIRGLNGHFLEKCHIWWSSEDWENAAPLVLVMENEEVRTEQ